MLSKSVRDFKRRIDECDNPNNLRDLLGELADEIDALENLPYPDPQHIPTQLHDLELLLRYGEHKLEKLLR